MVNMRCWCGSACRVSCAALLLIEGLGRKAALADRFCRNCGNELAEADAFCPGCGKPVQQVAHVPVPEANVAVPQRPQEASGTSSAPGGMWNTDPGRDGGTQSKKRWYQRGGWIIFFLIIFFPVGLYLMWKHAVWTNRTKWIVTGVVAVFALIRLASPGEESTTPVASESENQAEVQQAAEPEPEPKPEPEPAQQAAEPEPESAPPPEEAPGDFGDGTYQVGSDIQPGTYRTREGTSGCYYARLGGFSGEFDDILANGNATGPAIVTIQPTDVGFESQRCGTWTKDLSKITESTTSFDEGAYIVGTDIEPGTYKNSGSSGCYYARLSGFTGDFENIIANGNSDAPTVVTIAPTDAGFESQRCGTWTKLE